MRAHTLEYSSWDMWLRLCLVHVKYFPENKYFPEMLFSGKENIFKCLVAFQKMFWKIFSGVWLCSWKYHRKYIFYLLLTFSHIFSIAKQIYNIIPQYRTTKETKPRKNIHQIWSIQKYKRNKTHKKNSSNSVNTETQKKQNLEKKFIKSCQIERRRKRERRLGLI